MHDDRRHHRRMAVTPLPASLVDRQKTPEGIETYDDRRRFQRVAVTLPATLNIADHLLSATVRDISRSGAALEFGKPVPVKRGERVVFAGDGAMLRAHDAKVIASDGRICRLVFEPTLSAMDLLGVAPKRGR